MVSYWVLRQNYARITNQTDIEQLIVNQKIITCPWGGWGIPKEKVKSRIYNNDKNYPDEFGRISSNQDKKFVEDMNIGDIVLIPLAKSSKFIIARITSDIIHDIHTGMYWEKKNGHINIGSSGLPFEPVVRRIEILHTDFKPDMRTGIQTLTKMNSHIINQINSRYHF